LQKCSLYGSGGRGDHHGVPGDASSLYQQCDSYEKIASCPLLPSLYAKEIKYILASPKYFSPLAARMQPVLLPLVSKTLVFYQEEFLQFH
jgi:hypothetical protein